jgi:membrane protein
VTRKVRPAGADLAYLGALAFLAWIAWSERPRRPGVAVRGRPSTHAPSAAQAADEPGRGRQADRPSRIPPRGWADILWRSFQEIRDDDIASAARSIAFAGMLALFPALAAFVSLYGLFADPAEARQHLAILAGVVPAGAMTFLGEQMVRLAAAKQAGLSLTFVGGLVLSIWSANSGMKALFDGLNIAYEEREKRGFLRLNLVTLAFTLGAVLFLVAASAAVIVVPVVLEALRIDRDLLPLAWLRWPALLVTMILALAVLYRFGPSRERAKWRWVSYGGATASLLWLAGSAAFSWYLGHVAHYNATYGSLGAVFGFMMWLWLSALAVLCGAELNSEMEHQTAKDSTTGVPLPMGARGATMADTLGRRAPRWRIPRLQGGHA